MRKLLALAIAVVAVPAIALAAGVATAQQLIPTNGQKGVFNTPCRYSHRAPDDPIVAPGQPGLSHMHDFLGNTSTDASSTLETLKGGGSLCRRGADHSAYWVPTLYENDRPLSPLHANVYYRTAGRQPGTIEPFPQGLRLIAGDAKATGPGGDVVKWECKTNDDVHPGDPVPGFLARRERHDLDLRRVRRALKLRRRALKRARRLGREGAAKKHKRKLVKLRAKRQALRANPVVDGGLPVCPQEQITHLVIHFPDCWDGTSIDSADHKSHLTMARYPRGGTYRTCPATHSHAVPRLLLSLSYATRGGPGAMLASGPSYTAHADFLNAWDHGALSDLVARCLNADVDCGVN